MRPESLEALKYLRDSKTAPTVKTFDAKFAEVKESLALHITEKGGKVYLNENGKTVLADFKEQE